MDRTGLSSHPPKVRFPAFYLASLTAPAGSRVILSAITDACLRGRRFAPGQRSLGELVHRTARTVRRQLRVLVERGWVRAIRRGRRLTTIYRLSRSLFARLTGRPPRPDWGPYQQPLAGLVGALVGRLAADRSRPGGP